jgi:hypothetical protein
VADNLDAGSQNTQVEVGNGSLISMQTVQHIYNEITGRSEELSRSYSINHVTSFSDIKQLHIKLCQLYEQYNIVSKNCAVTLYHVDDQKQVFSSFERFELYDRTTLSPVENIRLEYNFLIVLPQVKKPQSYQIEINIQSRAAISQRAKLESNVRAELFMELFEDRTADFEIKYVDYTVARNIQIAIDSWFKGLTCSTDYSWLKPIKRFSDDFSLIFRLVSVPLFLWSCLAHYSSLLKTSSIGFNELYYAATITFGGTMLVALIAGRLGGVLKGAIRRIRSLSYINLTRGDEVARLAFENSNKKGWLKAAVSVTGVIILNLLSSWIAKIIGLGV